MPNKYDSTVARIAGNLLSSTIFVYRSEEDDKSDEKLELVFTEDEENFLVAAAVKRARKIVNETIRTEPTNEEEFEVEMFRHGKAVDAIKARRARTGCGLKEAKDELEALVNKR